MDASGPKPRALAGLKRGALACILAATLSVWGLVGFVVYELARWA